MRKPSSIWWDKLFCAVFFATGMVAAPTQGQTEDTLMPSIRDSESQTNELTPVKLLFVSSHLHSASWTTWKQILEDIIAKFFKQHSDLMDTDFSRVCRVEFSIDKDGHISNAHILKETGSRNFDDAAVSFVKCLQGRTELRFPNESSEKEVTMLVDFRTRGRYSHRRAD